MNVLFFSRSLSLLGQWDLIKSALANDQNVKFFCMCLLCVGVRDMHSILISVQQFFKFLSSTLRPIKHLTLAEAWKLCYLHFVRAGLPETTKNVATRMTIDPSRVWKEAKQKNKKDQNKSTSIRTILLIHWHHRYHFYVVWMIAVGAVCYPIMFDCIRFDIIINWITTTQYYNTWAGSSALPGNKSKIKKFTFYLYSLFQLKFTHKY